MASRKYKLTYFNARGRAEIARLIFALNGVDFEDVRVQREDWPTVKPKAPFGQAPFLEFDGKSLPQSKAIARFLAKQYNLTGANDVEAAFCDAYVDCTEDCTKDLVAWFREQDPEKKKVLFNKFVDENLKPYLVRFEKVLTDNGTGYLVGKNLTWADLYVFDTLQNFHAHTPDAFKPHPKLTDFITRISNLPKIKSWIEKRPKTEF